MIGQRTSENQTRNLLTCYTLDALCTRQKNPRNSPFSRRNIYSFRILADDDLVGFPALYAGIKQDYISLEILLLNKQ